MENKNLLFFLMKPLIKKLVFPSFVIAFISLRLAPVYILPIKSSLSTSHTIASILFFIIFLEQFLLERKQPLQKEKILKLILLFYFATISLSVIYSVNTLEFFLVYKNYVVGLLIFFVSSSLLKNRLRVNLIILILVLTAAANFIIELIIYFKPNGFYGILEYFFYSKFLSATEAHAQRSRFFIDFFDGSLIALFIYYFAKYKNTLLKLSLSFFVFLAFILATISNYRIQLITLSFSAILGLFVLSKKKLLIFFLLLAFVFSIYLGRSISMANVKYSTVERLFFEDQEDIQTILGRFDLWYYAVNMGLAYPLSGVGLGNFYDNLPKKTTAMYPYETKNEISRLTLIHPHNVFFAAFAETGLPGSISLALVLCYFILTDFRALKKNNKLKIFLIICFWSLFLSSLTGPRYILPYLTLFWVLRALILKA